MHKFIINKGLFTLFVVISLFWTFSRVSGQSDDAAKPLVYHFDIREDIMPSAFRTVQSALDEAHALNADVVAITMDTYGGMLDAADSIRTRLLAAKMPVIVYITNNAASAGALIAIACDSIYMSSFAKIGAASVVDQSGNLMPDKYQSFMRGIMRATAESSGRDPDIAAAMVGADKTIPGIIDSGRVLTFTTSEAIANNFCEGMAADLEGALALAGYTDYTLVEYVPSGMDKAMGVLLNPVLRGLCLTFIFLGLYFELQTPGIGLPLGIAITAALLYFAPLYIEGLATNWEVLLFVVGLILIGLEVFVIPGFGVAGVTGIAAVFISLILSMVANDGFNFEFTGTDMVVQAFGIVMGSIALTLIVIVSFFGRFLSSPLFKRVALLTSEQTTEGYTSNALDHAVLKGKQGKAVTDLRPAGKVEVETEWYDAQTDGEYLLKGDEVVVLEVKNSYIVVRKV